MPDAAIRELRAEDWTAYRELRLRALEGAPDAFGWTAEGARQAGDDYWQQLAADSATRADLSTLVVDGGPGSIVATCAVRVAEQPQWARLFAMWVDDGQRGRALGRQLLAAAEVWARERGLTRMLLHVTRGNSAAEHLYLSAGYTPTGAEQPLREGSDRVAVELGRSLAGSSPSGRGRTIEA